jgi:DNA-binding transcriptional ArsR family regulator
MPTATKEDRLSETFAALANSTRRAILAHLAKSAATVNELAEPFEMTLPGWWSAASKRSSVRARWTPHHWRRSRPGPSSIGPSGNPASTGWTSTSNNSCKRSERTDEHDDRRERVPGACNRAFFRCTGRAHLADVDSPGTLQVLVRARGCRDPGGKAGRAGGRHPLRVPGGAISARPDAGLVHRRIQRSRRQPATRLHRIDIRRARQHPADLGTHLRPTAIRSPRRSASNFTTSVAGPRWC